MSADSFAGQSIDAARRALTALLHSHAIESPDLDARLLTGAVLGLDLTGLMREAARLITNDEAAALAGFAQRRISGEPVARILGVKEFWGLQLRLSQDTLVPRPDTETVIEAALDHLGAASRHAPLRIADLGTGSGAILLALLSELPDAGGIATDISAPAVETARNNARRLGLHARAHFVVCNYASALAGPFDLIVSNPPYIRSSEIADLAIEVREHDSHRALDGGIDGLDAYRSIAPQAASLLAPDGLLVLEVGHDQSDAVAALMVSEGLTLPSAPRADLAGVRRAVIGRRPPR